MAIDTTLQKINRQSEEAAAADLARRLGLNYANLDDYPFNLEVLSLIPLSKVEEVGIASYMRSAHKIRMAVTHPEEPQTQQLLLEYAKLFGVEIEPLVISRTSMRNLMLAYAQLMKEDEERKVLENKEQQDKNKFTEHITDLTTLQNSITSISTTDFLDILLSSAINQSVSDIHIEPGEVKMGIRFRIDGVLQKVMEVPMSVHHHLVSRIKMLGSIKLDQKSISQDGRFSFQNQTFGAIDIRVSIVPTGYGEGIVLRLLHQDRKVQSLSELGFTAYNQQLIEKAIHRPYGLILVTGPTGSGKSTTLYSVLKELNNSEKKIITLEDPIEYKIDGVQQSQIIPEDGFTFAEGLKGAMRQDPDIIMVGEIRDPETATIALNASLTGHLVLSTLHTNNAVTAHTRFLEMGIPGFLLTGSINIIIAQRLVRKISEKHEDGTFTYNGRVVISEVLVPSTEFEQAVISHRDQATLQRIAEEGGMIPMVKDGLDKVNEGITTESEIYRVTTFE